MSEARAVLSREEYLSRWSALHGQAATSGLVGWWLGLTYRPARRLAALGTRPDAVTLVGLVIALAALAPAAGGGRWLLMAAVGVAVSGVLDSLDGATALLSGRASRHGFVLDSACDRLAEVGYVTALWLAGAPGLLAVLGGALAWWHEYVRARAAVAGMPEVGVVTVAERPTRVIVTAMFLLGCGLQPGAAATWATAGAAALTTFGAVGVVQLGITVARRLR